METYTIEDIEILRKKGNLSYQEAVALLDYHNGSLAHALIDLEKQGKIHEETNTAKEGNGNMNGNERKNDTKDKAIGLMQKLYRSRIKIRKGNTTIINVSIIVALLSLLAVRFVVPAIIIALILGYQFSFTSMDPEFASDNLEKMVKNAAQNAKSSVSSVVQTIATESKEKSGRSSDPAPVKKQEKQKDNAELKQMGTDDPDPAESIRQQAKELEATMDSFFGNAVSDKRNSAYSAAASKVPTIQVPVQTETRDGNVTVEDDQDGYSSVTIG